jgi:competence ComEA-like helix-hairpin-helix protein
MLARGELHNFCARILGWTSGRAVDLALRSIDLAAEHRAALVLCGAGDLVPIAWALHRRLLGSDQPFVVCDPRRGNVPASVRSPGNYESGARAVSAALGGSLCVRSRRLPRDFAKLSRRLASFAGIAMLVTACCGAAVGAATAERIQLPPMLATKTSAVAPRIIGKLNLNTATEEQLMLLPTVGPSKAERIVSWRKQHGGFKRTSDLRRVKGFGYKTFKELEPFLDIKGDTTLAAGSCDGVAQSCR